MDMRELKALEIAARARIVFNGTCWLVPSQTCANKYQVSIGNEPSCTCEDFQLRRLPCKHVLAAQLVCARDGNGKAPEIVTDAVPVRPTYKQNWPLYDLAQRTEKHRFQTLLADLCHGIESPAPPKTGRRPHLASDTIFAMVYKVYSTVSSRRFHCDLQDAHKRGHLLNPIPGMKVNSFLENADWTPILKSLIVQSSLPLRAVATTFAPDSSGFSTCRFVRWFDEKYGVERSGREWVKAHVMTGVKTNIITAVEILDKDAADCPQFKPLVETTAKNFSVKEAVADKAYLSHDNLELLHKMGGTAYVPFKSNSIAGEAGSVWERMFHYYNFNREDFLKHYHQRSNVESTFSMVKAKFKDSVRSKTDVAMKNEVLCKFLCHNICVVHQSQIELAIEPVFWKDEPAEEDTAMILSMKRPG